MGAFDGVISNNQHLYFYEKINALFIGLLAVHAHGADGEKIPAWPVG